MRATPKRLLLLGVALVVAAFLFTAVGAVVAYVRDESIGTDPSSLTNWLVLLSQIAGSAGVLALLAGFLAWVVKVGVRSARDE